MKLKNLPPDERAERLQEWKANMKVTCAECGETVRAKDAAHARTARGLPNYVCHACLRREGVVCSNESR